MPKAASAILFAFIANRLGFELGRAMKPALVFTLFGLVLASHAAAQDGVPLFKAEVKSAFVWGEDSPSGAVSSAVRDPLTGSEVLKLTHAEIEVSSQIGFEKASGQPGIFIAYTTTIVNNSNRSLSVRYGESTIDGRIVSPLPVLSRATQPLGKRIQHDRNAVDVALLHCFASAFLSDRHFFSLHGSTTELEIEPRSHVTVSSVIRDPRNYPILCSVDGCLPKGTIGYSIQVGSQDFIFIRPGRSLTDCGK